MKPSPRSLIKISLIGFLLFFIILYHIETQSPPKTTAINNLSLKNYNEYIKINGRITKQSIHNNTTFLEITYQNNTINGIIFNSNQKFNPTLNYSFEGQLTTYNTKLEIIIHKITQTK